MQRSIVLGFMSLLGFLCLTSCGKQDQKPVNVVVDVNNAATNGDPNAAASQAKLPPQQIYDAAIANAFRLLGEKKDDQAIAAFEEANAAVPTEFAKGEIERLKHQKERMAAAEHIAHDIQAVLDAGQALQASKLAADALAQYGDSDFAEKLTALKRQADALASVQATDAASKQKFLQDAEAAREAKNFRAALIAFDQAAAAQVDVTALKPVYEELRGKLTSYDEKRTLAADLRKDSSKLEEAITALEEAKKAWETPQVVQELQDAQHALSTRRDRVAVADFEVIGDVGIPLVGRTIAEEILPHFKKKYDLVEHSQVRLILDEMEKAASKPDAAAPADSQPDKQVTVGELQASESARSQLCKLAKARYLVVGSVSHLGGISVNARLVDSETGLVVQTAKIVAASPEELSAKLPELANVLQMTDEEKMAHEQELAKASTVAVAEPPATLPAAPPAPPTPDAPAQPAAAAPPPAPIVVSMPKPPEVGQVVAADFNNIPPPPAPQAQQQAVVIVEGAPWRERAFFVAIEVGDNLYRWGRFREAMRHYEFALSLHPGQPDVMARINNCVPFLGVVQVVAFQPSRPRLAVLPFVEMGVPYGMGCWTADNIAPYFYPAYDIVDTGTVYWWMARLGLTYRDVLVDPSARLLLARALGVRYLLFGNLRDNMGIDASTQIVDAEFNNLAASGMIHAGNPFELKMRLAELAQITLMPPEQRVVYLQERVVYQQQMQEAQISVSNGNFEIAIGYYEKILVAQPNNVEIRIQLGSLRRRHHRHQLEVASIQLQVVQQQQYQVMVVQQQQLQVQAQQQASFSLSISINVNVLQQQQSQVQFQMLTQARSAAASNNFSVSINIYESIPPAQRTTIVINELAVVRSRAAQAQQVRIAQQQALQQAQLRQQSQLAANAVITAQQNRIRAEQVALAAANSRNQAAYNQLLAQAQQAKLNKQFSVELSSYQTARTLQPSPQIDQLVAQAQADVAMANAAKKGPAEQAKVAQNLKTAQAQRAQADQKATFNAARYEESIKAAFIAMHNRNYVEGKREFQIAAKWKVTKETTDGIRWANDEIAKGKQEADKAQKAQQEQQKKNADFARLVSEGNSALNAKQFDPAIQKFQAAVNLKPTDTDAQALLVKAKNAKEDQAAQAHKQTIQPAKPVSGNSQFVQAIQRARTAIAANQFDAARTAIGEAVRIEPSNPENGKVQQELATAQKAHVAATKPPVLSLPDATQKEKFQALLVSARKSAAAKQIESAEQSLAQAKAINANDPQIAQVQQEINAAKVVRVNGTQEKQAAYDAAMKAGHQSLSIGKFDDAIRSAQDALRQKPNDPAANQLLTQAEKNKASVAAAQPKANEAEYEKWMGGARTTFGQKKYDLAIRYANEALKNKPGDAEAAKIISDSNAALNPKKDTAATTPKNDAAQAEYEKWIGGARTTFAQKKYDQAIQYANEALKHKPADPEATKIINDCHAAQTQPKPKDTVATPTPKTDANQAEFEKWMGGARTSFGQKKYDLAIRYAEEALKHKPGDPEAAKIISDSKTAEASAKKEPVAPKTDANQAEFEKWMGGAQTSFAQKKYDLAIRYAEEALKHKPGDPEATKIVNDSKAAQTPAKKEPVAPKTDPNQAEYDKWMGGARTTFGQKKYDQAIQYATEALKHKPGDAEATKIVNDSHAALTPAKKEPVTPKTDPNQAEYDKWMGGARTTFAQKKYDQAIQYANEALKHKPGDAEATKIVNDSHAALTPAKKEPVAPKTDPNQAEYDKWMGGARTNFAQKKYDLAIQWATEALKHRPADPEAAKIINDSHAALTPAKKEPAVAPPAKADPAVQVNTLLQTAASQERESKYADAFHTYNEVLKLNPTHAEAKKKVEFTTNMSNGLRQLNAGQFAGALAFFDQALRLYPNDVNAKHYQQLAKDKKKQ